MDNEIVNLKIKPNNQSMPNKCHTVKNIMDIFPNYGKTRPRFDARFGDSLKPKIKLKTILIILSFLTTKACVLSF